MTDLFNNKDFEKLVLDNKMAGEPYEPETKEEFDEVMKCWLPESDVPEEYWKDEK